MLHPILGRTSTPQTSFHHFYSCLSHKPRLHHSVVAQQTYLSHNFFPPKRLFQYPTGLTSWTMGVAPITLYMHYVSILVNYLFLPIRYPSALANALDYALPYHIVSHRMTNTTKTFAAKTWKTEAQMWMHRWSACINRQRQSTLWIRLLCRHVHARLGRWSYTNCGVRCDIWVLHFSLAESQRRSW